MDSLDLNLNKESLLDLMKNFHLLTEIKIALFNSSGNEILSYPEQHCPFCKLIRSRKDSEIQCTQSNAKSFRRCQTTGKIQIYHCHAGLTETTAPLIDNGMVIGYVMFGQVTDNTDKEAVNSQIETVLEKYGFDKNDYDPSILDINFKTKDQIQAAARILEACTFFVLLKDMVSLHRETFIENLNRFLLEHLNEDLSISRLTKELNISKNSLYSSCSRYLSTGIAEHIKNLRIKEACRLLKESTLSISEISDRVGFNDYNYFCRVFKKETGISAGKYRKS